MRGAKWTAPATYEIAATAQRYEDWEFPYALVLGLGAAARYAMKVGIDVAQERAFALAAKLRRGLANIPGARVLDRGKTLSAIVTADFAGHDATQVVRELRSRSINTASSLRWYGLLDFGERGVESAVRISPHYYNIEAEIAECIDLIAEMVTSKRHRENQLP
jgi:selenocysteine lyase/cysteine desulfurase